jgi:exopolysaccharide biosynthesis polyprenyl glycosylphosphotransferase
MIFESIIKRFTSRKIILFLGDFIALFIAVCFTLSFGYKHRLLLLDPFEYSEQFLFYNFILIITLFLYRYFNLYKSSVYLTPINQFTKICSAVFISSSFLILITFFFKSVTIETNARFHYVLFLSSAIAITFFIRYLFLRVLYKKTEMKTLFQKKILAVGAGIVGTRFAEKIKNTKVDYFDLVGFIDDDDVKQGTLVNGIPVLGKMKELDAVIRDNNIDEIFITIESISYEKLMGLIAQCRKIGSQVNLFSSHYDVIQRKVGTAEFENLKYIPISSPNVPLYTLFLKSIIDKIFTLIILIILSPVFLVISMLIKLTSRGSVFYRSKVIGKDGVPFTWYKFRTMKENNNQELHQKHLAKIIRENKSVEKLKNDPRITGLGKYLRKFSLDELPQLFSVLRGDMSLIGPRPCLPYEYDLMDDWQKRRTSVTPGITGLWQVTGRNKKDITFNDSIVLDLYYSENQSFGLDFKIFLKTIPIVLFGNGGT